MRPRGAARPAWILQFHRRFPKSRLAEPMSRHTTFHIGGPADAYLEVETEAELAKVCRFARRRRLPVFFIGWGSNLLVRDGGLRGIVARLRGEFDAVRFDGVRVFAGAGVRLPALVSACARRGLAGAEPLIGVPGTVGGALVMNAGTREGEIGDLVKSVRVLDRKSLKGALLKRRSLRFGYRSSNLDKRVILGAELELKPGSKVDILERIKNLQQRRLQTQPVHTFNVGSIFKNPSGRFVARLIEEAGLKGARCGGASISRKHANFFENHGGATARDVLDLVRLVRGRIRRRYGVELEPEMRIVGEA
ncbi:MAG: UDP-N-acetylmuramate dehydrogenase [Elusimicrobia bacterium]|nr:UDP-N-acetylmuramate dehydrogenase [Elusimicrobiota bacterium]